MLARTSRRLFMHYSKLPEGDSAGLWKWIGGLLGSEESDSEIQSSSDTDDEDGEGGLMIPIPKGVDGLCYIKRIN